MSCSEAKADAIPMKRQRNGIDVYYPPCRICGAPVYSWSYRRGVRYTCPKCKKVCTSVHLNSHQFT